MSSLTASPGKWVESGDSDRGVSPVVGVVLMIVLAVSLTVVVGGFTSDLVDQATVQSPPQASINVHDAESSGSLVVTHDGGESLDADTYEVVVRELNGERIDTSSTATALTPGDTLVVSEDGDTLDDGTEYEVLVIDDATGKVIDEGTVQYQD